MIATIVEKIKSLDCRLLIACSLMFVFTFFSYSVDAGNWNQKKKGIDLRELEYRRVPSTFPERSIYITEECKTSKGKSWTNTIEAFLSNDLFYAVAWGHNQKEIKIYEGKRTSRNKFVINVSEAAQNWSDKPIWIRYDIKGKNLLEALQKGDIEGIYRSRGGSYSRTCKIFSYTHGDPISVAKDRPKIIQKNALKRLSAFQKGALKLSAKLGLKKSRGYDFEGLGIRLQPAVEKEMQEYELELALKDAKKKANEAQIAADKLAQTRTNELRNLAELEQAQSKVIDLKKSNTMSVKKLMKKETDRVLKAEEARRKAEEAAKVAAAETEKKKAQEAAKLAAADEARKKAEDTAKLVAAEEARKKAEEAVRLAAVEEARKKAEEAEKIAAAEEARKRAAEAQVAALKLAAEEAKRIEIAEAKRVAEIEAARKRAEEKEKKLLKAKLLAKKAEDERKLASLALDKTPPEIYAEVVKAEGAKAQIRGQIKDDMSISSASVDDIPIEIDTEGMFTHDVYIPRSGKTLSITAVDEAGKETIFELVLKREKLTSSAGPKFAALNPVKRESKLNKDAIAMIIGIADYERTKARAAYADEDAKFFYDYATLKLGVPEGNILELRNENADLVELNIATNRELKRMVRGGKSDIYIFFAGHGMASDDGKNMYLLPYDGAPELLKKTAISRDDLFADIKAADPRSVTVFFDTCYSGQSRGEDMLVAARPVLIKAIKKDIPDNFTVFSAAAGDQTAKSLEEVKHGMFSYFLMKGMEGGADKNQDNKITAGELHEYVKANVVQQSSGSQTPELQGEMDRVLVRFQ